MINDKRFLSSDSKTCWIATSSSRETRIGGRNFDSARKIGCTSGTPRVPSRHILMIIVKLGKFRPKVYKNLLLVNIGQCLALKLKQKKRQIWFFWIFLSFSTLFRYFLNVFFLKSARWFFLMAQLISWNYRWYRSYLCDPELCSLNSKLEIFCQNFNIVHFFSKIVMPLKFKSPSSYVTVQHFTLCIRLLKRNKFSCHS